MMTEHQIKHLELIQAVVTRMGSNSFQLKAWAVTIVSAILAVYASTQNAYVVLVGIFACVPLWLMDAYYLTQERRYRGLYDDVAGVTKPTTPVPLFAMGTVGYSGGRYALRSALCSGTVAGLYLPICVGLAAMFFCLRTKGA